ncbi:MAG: hypothetical protein IT286_02695, partial [Proteobacteria bacterium]|nr:hypothetical protein [Pseudomonadota bacterium]
MKRNNIWLMGMIGMIACGSSNTIQVSAPGVVSGSIQVLKLNDSLILEKNLQDGFADLTGAEVGLEGIRIYLKDGTYTDQNDLKSKFSGEGFSAIASRAAELNQINVNAITTLASCRIQKNNIEQVDLENGLLAKQFLLMDIHHIQPNINLEKITSLNQEAIYGLLIKGFERLAKVQNVTVTELLAILCQDVKFDGRFDGISEKGDMTSQWSWYDDQ